MRHTARTVRAVQSARRQKNMAIIKASLILGVMMCIGFYYMMLKLVEY